jgi:sec-independent protein translocase protein TatC
VARTRLLAGSRLRRLRHEEEVPVVEHLDELRTRLIISLSTVGVAFLLCLWQHEAIIEVLNRQLPANIQQPTTLDVTEPFRIALTVSLWSALLLALPVLFYQLYAFVIPAVDEDHERTLWPVLIFVPALFLAGAAFGYFAVVPAALNFLTGFDSELYNEQVRAGSYYPFVVQTMVALGCVFEMPAAILALTRVGVVSSQLLRANRKYAIFMLALVAAALPGGDPVTMMLILAPLLVLYELSVVLSRLVERRSEDTVGDALGDT